MWVLFICVGVLNMKRREKEALFIKMLRLRCRWTHWRERKNVAIILLPASWIFSITITLANVFFHRDVSRWPRFFFYSFKAYFGDCWFVVHVFVLFLDSGCEFVGWFEMFSYIIFLFFSFVVCLTFTVFHLYSLSFVLFSLFVCVWVSSDVFLLIFFLPCWLPLFPSLP